jgi:TetR/AcrR family transcriptional regulator, mexJK operon transcriptional repressor
MNIQTRSHRYQSSRETILATSRDVFLRHGYSDASMDAIAQRSGVSKTTLYAHFESKEALFNQVVVDVVSEHEDDAGALLEFSTEEGIRDRLVTIGRRILDMLLDPEATALIRLCVIEGARMPRLGTESLTAARANLLHLLAGFFREHAAAGELVVEDPREAADLFIVLTLRDTQLQAMLPWSTVNTTEAHGRNADRVADLILRLYGRRPAA